MMLSDVNISCTLKPEVHLSSSHTARSFIEDVEESVFVEVFKHYNTVQNQKAVSAHSRSEQIL